MRPMRIPFSLSAFVFLALLIATPSPAFGAVFQVTKTTDTNDGQCDGDCSLREAIIAANSLGEGENLIELPAGNYFITIPGSGENGSATGDLDILVPMLIRGQGKEETVVNALGEIFGVQDRVFHVLTAFGGTVSFEKIGINNGYVPPGAGVTAGGGLLVANGANIILNQCGLYGNEAPYGGGIYISGMGQLTTSLRIEQSVLQKNRAYMGAALAAIDSEVLIEQSTLFDNESQYLGAVDVSDGALGVRNSTLYRNGTSEISAYNNFIELTNSTVIGRDPEDNSAIVIHHSNAGLPALSSLNSIVWGRCAPEEDPSLMSLGGNWAGPGNTCGFGAQDILTEIAPLLLPLGDYGGPTPTAPPYSGTPALDGGVYLADRVPDVDQRGVARPQEGDGLGAPEWDIGAVEREPFSDVFRRYIDDLRYLVRDSSIPDGIQKELVQKTSSAENSYLRDNFRAAVHQLKALNHNVEALRVKKLSPELADSIVFVSSQAIAVIGIGIADGVYGLLGF